MNVTYPVSAPRAVRRALIVVLAAAAFLPVAPLRADTIVLKTATGTAQIDGTIESINAKEMVYTSGAPEQPSQAPVDSVMRIIALKGPELTAAEHAYADGKWADAVTGYQAALNESTAEWARYRAIVRLIDAAARDKQLGPQVAALIELTKRVPANAQAHRPRFEGLMAGQIGAAIAAVDPALKSPGLKKESADVVGEFPADLYLAGDYVRDNAGKFSKHAVAQAERTIKELISKHHHELIVETYPAIPDAMRDDFAAKGKEPFFEEWAERRFKAEGVNGVGVLICMDPRRLQVVVGNNTQKKLFTAADRVELVQHLTAMLRDDQFDDGLTSTASFVLRKFDEHDTAAAQASGAPAAPLVAKPDGAASTMFSDSGDARRIIFVSDADGSMLQTSLKNELQKAVNRLKPIQSFNIILFQEHGFTALDKTQLIVADPANKKNAFKWLDDVRFTGATDPIAGLTLALEQHPQVIYLVDDGDFADKEAVKNTIAKLDPNHNVKINTIAFVSHQDPDKGFIELMQQIAKDSGGSYKRVAESDLDD